MNKHVLTISLLISLMIVSSLWSQGFPDEITIDSTDITFDSTFIPFDSIKADDRIETDTVVMVEFYSLDDSLYTYLLSSRFSYGDEYWRSFGHDPGDYLKYNPSNVINYYQPTPVRTTVSPFNLPGNRMNVIFNKRQLNPIAHLMEPDNMIDFNDILTTPVQNYYNLEGPVGLALGADNATSSLILIPHEPVSTRAESKMVVNTGSFGYAYTKGLFTHRNSRGRSLKAAMGYRKAEGAFSYRDDESYHQWAELIYPHRTNGRLILSGRLYRQNGTFPIRPVKSGNAMNRFRSDRDLTAEYQLAHQAGAKSTIEYRHQRLESKTLHKSSSYYRDLDIIHNSIIFSHERKMGQFDIKLSALGSQERYSDNYYFIKHHRGSFDIKFLKSDSTTSMLGYLKVEKFSEFDPLPSAVLVYNIQKEKSYLSGSIGYAAKFPRTYELDLERRYGNVYTGVGAFDYLEHGNPDLKPEKQLIGNITLGLGAVDSDLMVSITGGKIFDGIDWKYNDEPSGGFFAISPENNDIEFVNVTGIKKFHWKDNVIFSGGGSYRYLKIDDDENTPYSPNYQLFSGLQLYYYVEKLELHLYGYGEAQYNDIYYGYNNEEYGRDIILNAKLSFRIKKFHFFYVFQNIIDTYYNAREDYLIPGRFHYYGLTWEFLD